MTFVNIVIPVCSLHKMCIQKCIDSINRQTRIPDKIILVLNEYEKYKTDYDVIISNNLECEFVKINTWEKPGINRNIGSNQCSDGIILYQDVDDIMHPQRCELVEKCFDKYDCDLLLHESVQDYTYSYQPQNFILKLEDKHIIMPNDVTLKMEKTLDFINYRAVNFAKYFGNIDKKNKHSSLHNGQCCVKTKILKENKNIWADYYEAEDIKFVNDVTRKYKNTIILMMPLVIVVGREHIRLIDKKVCHKKNHKVIDYDPVLNK